MPPGTSQIVLTVNSFSTELNADKVLIYDLGTSALLATLTGTYTTLPAPIISTTGQVMIMWVSNNTVRGEGWDISYSPMVGTVEHSSFNDLSVYPNPASQVVNIGFTINEPQNVIIEFLSINGSVLYNESLTYFKGIYLKSLNISSFNRGIYLLRVKSDKGTTIQKVVVQ